VRGIAIGAIKTHSKTTHKKVYSTGDFFLSSAVKETALFDFSYLVHKETRFSRTFGQEGGRSFPQISASSQQLHRCFKNVSLVFAAPE